MIPRIDSTTSYGSLDSRKVQNVSNTDATQSFMEKITFIVSILLLYPVALLYMMHEMPSVSYWYGNWAFYWAVSVPAWIFFSHILLNAGVLKQGNAAVLIIVIPAALLAIVCHVQGWEFNDTASLLISRDCQSFMGKAHLQTAWMAADMFLDECRAQIANLTGVSYDNVAFGTNMEKCPGYTLAFESYKEDWGYLKYVEGNHLCGGWCIPHQTLWYSASSVQDSCSMAVGRSLGGHVKLIGTQITVYCSILLLVASSVLLVAPTVLGAT